MYGAAYEEFTDWGMALNTKPKLDMPQIPDDLGDLGDQTLMDLFTQHTQWMNYVAVRLTKAEVDEDDAERALAFENAKYIVSNTIGKDDKVTILKAERDTDPEIEKLHFEVLRAKAFRKMTATLMQNLERSTFLLSRELTRRTGLAPITGRKNTGA